MMSIKGTKTEQNLLKAFAGESQAYNRYIFFAKQARKDGYEQIAAFFEETAAQEQQHAKIFFEFLEGGMVEITGSYPAGVISNTADNLAEAAEGEYEEWDSLYPEFARVAEEEGFKKVAMAFKLIIPIEKSHEERYRKLLQNLQNDEVFQRSDKMVWVCRKCGYIHYGEKALEKCPCCAHPKAFFEIKATNY
ncbi:MAG: rubrerythrin family protein [Bacteroidales bacterium]|jgi:rubrerythrin|nr:rubrerythrin family protein [Bacteroidales bacterium]